VRHTQTIVEYNTLAARGLEEPCASFPDFCDNRQFHVIYCVSSRLCTLFLAARGLEEPGASFPDFCDNREFHVMYVLYFEEFVIHDSRGFTILKKI